MTDLRDDEDFAALLTAAGDVPVVIDFWAPWCVPCKTMTPLAEALAADFAESTHFVKVDIDAAPELAARFGVRGVPTFLRLENGSETARLTGLTTRTRLAALFEGDAA